MTRADHSATGCVRSSSRSQSASMSSCASSRARFGLRLLPVEGVVLVVASQFDSSFERVSAQDVEAVSVENVVSGSGTFVEEREDEEEVDDGLGRGVCTLPTCPHPRATT